MAATKQTTAERSWSQRKAKRHAPPRSEPYCTPEAKAEFVRLLKAGCTATEICDRADMPSKPTFYDWKRADPVFADDVEAAMIEGARTILEDAADMVREASEPVMDFENSQPKKKTRKGGRNSEIDAEGPAEPSADTSLTRARVAQIMFDVARQYAEKVAPRQYGQLVKLSDASGEGPLAIQVVNFATQASEKQSDLGNAQGAKTGEGA